MAWPQNRQIWWGLMKLGTHPQAWISEQEKVLHYILSHMLDPWWLTFCSVTQQWPATTIRPCRNSAGNLLRMSRNSNQRCEPQAHCHCKTTLLPTKQGIQFTILKQKNKRPAPSTLHCYSPDQDLLTYDTDCWLIFALKTGLAGKTKKLLWISSSRPCICKSSEFKFLMPYHLWSTTMPSKMAKATATVCGQQHRVFFKSLKMSLL